MSGSGGGGTLLEESPQLRNDVDIDTVEWVFGFRVFEDDMSERQTELLGLQFHSI